MRKDYYTFKWRMFITPTKVISWIPRVKRTEGYYLFPVITYEIIWLNNILHLVLSERDYFNKYKNITQKYIKKYGTL